MSASDGREEQCQILFVYENPQVDESGVSIRLVERCFLSRGLGSSGSGVHVQQHGLTADDEMRSPVNIEDQRDSDLTP